MERWEAVVRGFPESLDFRYFVKVLGTASVVLKEDLAPFESDWITETLLFKPVELLRTVSSKCTDDSWTKVIRDSFKLLTTIVTDHGNYAEKYYEDIVTVCLQETYDSITRSLALNCVAQIARRSSVGARNIARHIHLLLAADCRARASLVGTICEFHPQVMVEHKTQVWRIYLNLLDSNKISDTVLNSVLEGILGLFKHFGADLSTAELNDFFEKMASQFMNKAKCQEVCHKIISQHASLFREQIACNSQVRRALWSAASEAASALRSAYTVTGDIVDRDGAVKIINEELIPHTQSYRTQEKYTALRIIDDLQRKFNVNCTEPDVDVLSLEFELRNSNVSYDVAEAVSFCIESKQPNSDKLLQTAMLFYDNLPSSRRKDVVVRGLLNAETDVRNESIKFLITESCQDTNAIDNYLPLWMDIFEYRCTDDHTNLQVIFEDVLSNTVFVLDSFLEEDFEIIPDKLSNLLLLSSHVISLQETEDYVKDYCSILMSLIVEITRKYGGVSSAMAVARASCGHLEDVPKDLYELILIDRCRDDALLCESCLVLLHAPEEFRDNILMALEIIFSRNDVEPKMLSKSLQKLESMVLSQTDEDTRISEIVQQVIKLRDRSDLTGKDARILHRDILMFLGKYGNKAVNTNKDADIENMIVKLKDTLTLNVPNPYDGSVYKLNLQQILHVAIVNEDPETLQVLITILSANSTTRSCDLSLPLTAAAIALSRSHSCGAQVDVRFIQDALLCVRDVPALLYLLKYMSVAQWTTTRGVVADALDASLKTELLVTSAAERAASMLASEIPTTKRAGLDITGTLINALKENNSLTIQFLPKLLVLISKTDELDSEITFESATKLFMEKIELFDRNTVDSLQKDLLITLLERKSNMADVKVVRKSLIMCLGFIKNILDYRSEDGNKICELFWNVFKNQDGVFSVLADMRRIFDLNEDLCRQLLSNKDCRLLNKLYCTEIQYDDINLEGILKYLEEYAGILLELRYQRTCEFLSKIIESIPPSSVKNVHKHLNSCLSAHERLLKKKPRILITKFENWCRNLPLKEITYSIDKELFEEEHAQTVNALKIMLNIFNLSDLSVLTDVTETTERWPKILLKLFSSDYIEKYLKSKMAYLTDIMTVSLKFTSVTAVKRLILEGGSLEGVSNEKIGIKFGRFFIGSFCGIFLVKPFFLLDEDMEGCCLLLNDIVKYAVKVKCTDEQYDNVLELVNELWPKYERQATFQQKHTLLLNMAGLPKKLQPDSNPMQWAIRVISEGSTEEKARIIGVLPGGEAYSEAYTIFASSLPTRLSEQNRVSFRSLLDALAVTREPRLFQILIKLCRDDTAGWWDEVIKQCLNSLASGGGELCEAAYSACFEGLSLTFCRRVCLPLLTYSSPSFCEVFFSRILKRETERLGRALSSASLHYAYRERLCHYVNSFTLFTAALQMIPPSSFESPNSVLYRDLSVDKPWHLMRVLGKCCLTLRDKVLCPENADAEFKELYRLFQCANYNCLCAAVCCWKPPVQVYERLFNLQVWSRLVDNDVVYQLPLKSQLNRKTIKRPVAIDTSSEDRSGASTTMRSRALFLRTLSEDALKYDLIQCRDTDEVIVQEIEVVDNELDRNECSLTLTALLRHCSCLPHTTWRVTLCDALKGALHKNAKYLLAQAICNNKEQLKAHASDLTPALLAFVCESDTKLLNALHVDMLEAILHWDSFTDTEHLNTAVEYLIATCLVNRGRKGVFASLLNTLGKVLGVCSYVHISWTVFEPYVHERTEEAKKTIQILQLISKSKIYMPNLLPTILSKVEQKQHQLVKLSEIFGLALSACSEERVRQDMLVRYRDVLDKVWKSGNYGDYVKLLFYAQNGFSGCCTENNFRKITDLVPKMPGAEKSKCLQIIASYISTASSQFIADMFDTVELCELLIGDHAVDALAVGREGLSHMECSLKRRVVMQACSYSLHSDGKVRKAALQLVLKALEELYKQESSHQYKRPRVNKSTPILKAVESKDVYTITILTSLGLGCVDGDLGSFVRDGLSKLLDKNMAVRFVECFILTLCLNKCDNKTVCLYAFLDLLLSDLRTHERFLKAKLRDEPLENRDLFAGPGPSKLVTLSRTYKVGTFRSASTRSRVRPKTVTKPQGIDVQISIDSILNTFLQFAKTTPEVSESMCLQLLKCLVADTTQDLGTSLSAHLGAMLDQPGEATAFVVHVARSLVEYCSSVDGFTETVTKLKDKTRNTEGEDLVQLLHEEVLLRTCGRELFVLGCPETYDVNMQEDTEFSIEDLTAMFGKLSNWDSLRSQERRQIKNSGLPPLWTDEATFNTCLEDYTGTAGWFGKLVSAYRHTDKQNTMQWLREVDTWPRNTFAISAVTEAMEWQVMECDQHKLPSDILVNDCIAEWAARFLIRRQYLKSLETDSEQEMHKLSRSHELKWCERANEMGLSSLVLPCIKRNTVDLYESETLPWLRQKVLALRAMALERNDSRMLTKALENAETNDPDIIQNSSQDAINQMNLLVLRLSRDLKCLSTHKVENILKEVNKQHEVGVIVTQSNRKTLSSIYEIAITYYDDLFEGDDCTDETRNDMLSSMINTLSAAVSVNPVQSTAVVINRLCDMTALRDDVTASLLALIQTLAPTLDECFFHELRRHSKLFPSRLLSEYLFMSERDDTVYKKWLQLLCDPEHTLLHYCGLLKRALVEDDKKEWDETFARMREKMFDNKYAGTDYQLLTKYKNNLYQIEQFESPESYKNDSKKILNEIIKELSIKRPRSVLLLSQLCPELSRVQDSGLNGLLGLPAGVTVVKFDEQLEVFVDSIRRPVILTGRLSTGVSQRWVHKCGEPLRRDLGAVSTLRHAHVPATLYQVTMTSEDSALIEFLEHHERLRSLILSSFPNLDAVFMEAERTADHELILKPAQAAIEHHYRFSEKVPRHALRSAIERNSASVQDFINRKKKFQETISAMTIINWILGLGDRHLQNIMYDTASGRVCCIDWGAVFTCGRAELPCARLTNNILAACDTRVLESQLQTILNSLRMSHKTFLAAVKIAFKWMGEEFEEKFSYIKSILEGRSLSYQITKDAIQKSDVMYKEKYMDLFDNVFIDYDEKEYYSVEEQISCLLRQCTDPHILGVTRSGWEPWV